MYDNIFNELPIYRVLNGLNQTQDFRRLSESSVVKADTSQDLQSFVLKLRQAIGRPGVPFSTKIGTHPDFVSLQRGKSQRAAITSVFLDIKGSTQLFEKYDYERAFLMQEAIIQSAIYIIQAFDGHVVRIQGDGIFAVFGRNDYSVENGVLDSLNAASTLLIILESYLSEKFQSNGLKPLRVRVGIDHDKQSLWRHNGIDGCNELSPHGYHVSMASKLQSKANSNSIMIGEHIRELLHLPAELISQKKYTENGREKYDPFVRGDYKMWEFDWNSHASHFSWVTKASGKLLPSLNHAPDFTLHSALLNKDGVLDRKFSSSMEVFKKGNSLKFSIGVLPKNCTVRWYVENRGEEAEAAKCLYYEIPDSRNKTNVERDTAYHGQHFLICKVTYPSGKTIEKRIGVFIGHDWEPGTEREVTETRSSSSYFPTRNSSVLIPQRSF
ncbi:MAG: hypothetical protein JNM24_06710 [Bdellovibrionaceae bacterium]|nr:hypothetical protein [Pseudobdellovibrionaceae bacterium]